MKIQYLHTLYLITYGLGWVYCIYSFFKFFKYEDEGNPKWIKQGIKAIYLYVLLILIGFWGNK